MKKNIQPVTISFSTRNQWRLWLKKNHASNKGVWVQLYKKHIQRGLQYSDAVEEALCFGWIDGQLKRIDNRQHKIRFTPRNKNSVWAPSNITRVKKMIKEKKMTPAGLNLFRSANLEQQTAPTTSNTRSLVLPPDLKRALMRQRVAWQHWQNRPPSGRRIAIWWVRTAIQPETRLRRIQNIVRNTARYAKPHY